MLGKGREADGFEVKSPVRRACAVLLAAVLIWALTPARAAQAPAAIEAVDAPGPGVAPFEVTVATGTTVRWEFDQATPRHTVTSTRTN